MAITPKLIFPNSSEDVERTIISFTSNEGLVNLCRVNRAANEIITNIFFSKRFMQEHPALDEIDFKFEKLCNYFPGSWAKIACCAFSKGELRLSLTFVSEQSPNIHKYVQSQKAQLEMQLKELCGSYYQDPNSRIHQAWETYQTVQLAISEYREQDSSLKLKFNQLLKQLSENLPDVGELVIEETAHIFAEVLKNYTDEQLLNPSDEEPVAIHDELFHAAKKKYAGLIGAQSDESLRSAIDDAISRRFSDLNTILTSNHGANSNLLRSLSKLSIEGCSLEAERRFNDNDLLALDENYKYLEEIRVKRAEKLEKTEEELKMFGPTGKIALNDISQICHFENLLVNEFWNTQKGEMAIVRLPSLVNCANFIKNLVENPEQVSSDNHLNIQQIIDALDVTFSNRIWQSLYDRCANGIEESLWPQNHFPEFLPDLMDIVNSVASECHFFKKCMVNPNSIDSSEADLHLFLSKLYAKDSISMKPLME